MYRKGLGAMGFSPYICIRFRQKVVFIEGRREVKEACKNFKKVIAGNRKLLTFAGRKREKADVL